MTWLSSSLFSQRYVSTPLSLAQKRSAALRQSVDGTAGPLTKVQDLTQTLSGMGKALDNSAQSLEKAAQDFQRKAAERAKQAREEVAVKQFLTRAQGELNQYAVNLEDMMAAGSDPAKRGQLLHFPRQVWNRARMIFFFFTTFGFWHAGLMCCAYHHASVYFTPILHGCACEQAADLHAMLDESLSKADAVAVKMALGEQAWDDEEGVKKIG